MKCWREDAGWAGLGQDAAPSKNVYLLKTDVPHVWLFPQCRSVVHHGGAGESL